MIHDCSQNLGATCGVEEKDEPVTIMDDGTIKPMEAAGQVGQVSTPEPATPCSCKGGHKVAMSVDDKKALVTKILAAPGSVFRENQRAALEVMDEELLQVLAGAAPADDGKPKEVKTEAAQAPAAQVAIPAATPTPLTPEQWWAQAPPELANVRSLAARAAESDKQEKDSLVRALSTAQEAFTEAQLSTMDLTNLRSLASLTGVFLPRFDYTGAAGALTRDAASSAQDKEAQVYHNPPRPFDKLREAKSGKSTAAATGASLSKETN